MLKTLLEKLDKENGLLPLFLDLDFKKNVSIFDTNFGTKSWMVGCINNPIIYVTESYDTQTKLAQQLSCFGKRVESVYNIDFDTKISAVKSQDNQVRLINALCKIITNKLDCLIISPKILLAKLPSFDLLSEHILRLNINKEYDIKHISQTLLSSGYKRTEMVENKGEFSVRGDIVDIFSIGEELPFRLEFFGDELESINSYNIQNYSKIENLESCYIFPNTLCFVENKSQMYLQLDNLVKNIAKKLSPDDLMRLRTNIEQLKFRIENDSFNGIENFVLPLLKYTDNILSFVPKNFSIIFDDVKQIVDKISVESNEFVKSINLLEKTGDAFAVHKNLIIETNSVFDCNLQKISFQNINTSNRIFSLEKVYNFRQSSVTNFYGNYEQLCDELSYYLEFNYTVMIYAGENSVAVHLQNFLSSKNMLSNIVSNAEFAKSNQINIIPQKVLFGTILVEDKIAIIGTTELLGKQDNIKLTKKTKREVFALPKINDYVVHEKYGIGKCVGIERRKFAGFEKDYIALEYAGGDKLYVPTEQMDLISSYISPTNTQKLSRLGTQEFQKLKEKVKSSVKQMAFSLLTLYATRQNLKGFKYSPDDELTRAFESAFPYELTNDQAEAIKQIKNDMISGKLMDRLVCGDVGYGKTEVALRAIFKAVQCGKQVAFLAPTTILSEQHFNTCFARMNNFMVKVAVLNRFKTAKEQKQILKDVLDGKIDVLVGTHRLLSKDVVFKDLGLLVLDEEQRFGVQDKEKIKNIKRNVDVLTLSATPIPRTLHMSLSGIRDISLITTAPEGRQPVQTVVTEFSDILVQEALTRELNRGGQAIVVYNSIEHIFSLAEKIKKLVGDNVKIGVAHGQMDEKTLENVIYNLYSGQIDILVSTTLIENGINLPNANTLIVKDADKLGLSQLYQLRGRVGRATRLGYAYFTYEKSKVMTEDAFKRLNALMEFTELGSGFKIAMRDLEIRGCGNVMGKEQHGHMDKVGYDMYCKLLNQAVAELKGEQLKKEREVKIDISINAFIPNDYIVDSDARFRVYNLLLDIKTENDRIKVLDNIRQMYGKNLPVELENLSHISLLRFYAQSLGVSRIAITTSKFEVEFYEKQALLNDNLNGSLSNCGLNYVLNLNALAIIVFKENTLSIQKKLEKLIELFCSCVEK